MLLKFSSHPKYMDINILHNLEKQRLIVRKLLVPIPILLFSDGKKKKRLIVLAIIFFSKIHIMSAILA